MITAPPQTPAPTTSEPPRPGEAQSTGELPAQIPRSGREPTGRADIPRIHARDLFGAGPELLIEHADCIYRLRITRNNRLILTK